MINVLVVVGSMGVGGNERFVLNLVKFLNRKKFNIDLLIYSDDGLNQKFYEQATSSVRCVYLLKHTNENKYKSLIRELLYTRKIIKGKSYDIVHCNSCSLLGLLRTVVPVKIYSTAKIIAHSHNSGSDNGKLINKLVRGFLKLILSWNIDAGFTCSDLAGKSKYTEKFMKTSRYIVINNAVECEKYDFNAKVREELRTKIDADSDTIVLGNVGRMDDQKNQEFLLDIVYKMKERNIKVKLIVVGDGYKRKLMTEKIEKMNLFKEVYLLGVRQDVNELYNMMDVFMLPSLYEGFPFVLIEAQLNGLPCIVSDAVSRTVDVTHNTIFLPLDGLHDKWIDAIKTSNKKRLDESQLTSIREKYDVSKEIDRIAKIYMELLRPNRK